MVFVKQYNESYFVLKRQLEQETKHKLSRLPDLENGMMYVLDWWSTGEIIYAYGCDETLNVMKMRVDVEPGFYATTNNVELLTTVCGVLQHRIQVFPDFTYTANNFAPHDVLTNPEIGDRPSYLVKIITRTFAEAMDTFRKFTKDSKAYRYAHVPLYWSEMNLVMFERMIKCHKPGTRVDYRLPKVIMRWFDRELNCYIKDDLKIPIITFDIETVSKDPNRVPTGEHEDDELYTVSIHHMHTKILYTLIYLPITGYSTDKMHAMIMDDDYPQDYTKTLHGYVDKNVVECFRTERDLLVRTLELLQVDSRGEKLHFLAGYNSLGYDIKYLFLRAKFYELDEFERFVYRDGYAYGSGQIHLDVFRIMMMQYKMKNYKLSNVSTQLLHETKVGVDAVQLRFTFHAIRDTNRYYTHAESTAWPSVRDTLHYNNYDTILVSKLVDRCFPIQFVINQAHDCKISIFSLNTNYNKMQFKLWSKCFVVGLNMGVFLGTFKSSQVAIKYPTNWECTDFSEYRMNLETQLNVSDFTDCDRSTKKKAQYPGGANFCLGEFLVDNVDVLDYRIAYPLFIERMNVSDETATILPAKVISNLARRLTDEQRSQFKTYDYMTHTGVSKSATTILYHQYIYNNLYCGKEFPFEQSQLDQRGNSPVIVIWTGRRGILSQIITNFNNTREDTKNLAKLLDAVISAIDNKLTDIRDEQEAIETLQQESQDGEYETVERDTARVVASVHETHGRDDGDRSSGSRVKHRTMVLGDSPDGQSTGRSGVDGHATFSGRGDHETEGGTASSVVDRGDDDDDGDFGGSDSADSDDDGCFGAGTDIDSEGANGAVVNGSTTNGDNDDGDFGFDELDEDGKSDDEHDGDFGVAENDEDDGDFGFASENESAADSGHASSRDLRPQDRAGSETNIDRGVSVHDGAYNSMHPRCGNDDVKVVHSHSNGGIDEFGSRTTTESMLSHGQSGVSVGPCSEFSEAIGSKRKSENVQCVVDSKRVAINPFNFGSDVLIFYPNNTFDFNNSVLSSMSYDERIETLEKLSVLVASERDAYRNSYELQKAIVASIYGCLGRSSKITAAITTNGIRRTILEAAQYVVSLGYTVYYIDTDSLFIKHPTRTDDVSPQLNAMFPHTEIERKSYARCLFERRKTYYVMLGNEFRYFQNINGSPMWREFVYFAYHQSHIKTNDDIYTSFKQFFDKVYTKLLSFNEVTPEFLSLITQDVKIMASYKNSNPRSKLREFLYANYPTIASNYRQTIYYQFGDSIKTADFMPSIHMRDVKQLRSVNLFKFYLNVFKTVFNLIKCHIKRNNEPFVITLDSKPVLLMMISAYLDVYRTKFPNAQVACRPVTTQDIVDIASDVNNEDDEQMIVERINT